MHLTTLDPAIENEGLPQVPSKQLSSATECWFIDISTCQAKAIRRFDWPTPRIQIAIPLAPDGLPAAR